MSAMPLLGPGRRIALTLTVTVAGGVALLALKPHATGTAAGPVPAADGPAATAGPSTGPSSGGSGSAGSGSTGSSSGGSSSGGSGSGGSGSGGSTGGASGTRTVDGAVVQTRYGPVQVRITLNAGRLTAVKILQVPDGNPRDQEITSFAVPQLTQEALAAQSADIDTVSGATYTSEGYAQSLQSALDQAHA